MCNVSILSYYLASSAHSLWAWDLWTRCSLSLIFLNFHYFFCISCFVRTNHSIEFDAVSVPTQQPPWPFWHHWSGFEFIFNAWTLFWSENHFCCFLQELAWLFLFCFFTITQCNCFFEAAEGALHKENIWAIKVHTDCLRGGFSVHR